MMEFAKVYVRSIVAIVSMTAGLAYLATVHGTAVDANVVMAWFTASLACVIFDKPVE